MPYRETPFLAHLQSEAARRRSSSAASLIHSSFPSSDSLHTIHFPNFPARRFLTGTYRYSVSRLMPNSRASAAFESPSATRRRNSAARVGDNDGFLPVYFPSLFAIAIPSRWRSRISSLSNSALCGAPHKAAWKATASALPRKLEPARAETAQTLI